MLSSNGKSLLGDIKRISLIVGITLGLGTAAGSIYKFIVWTSHVQTGEAAKIEHDELVKRIYTRASKEDLTAHEKSCDIEHHEIIEAVEKQQDGIKEDLRVIKGWLWNLKERGR